MGDDVFKSLRKAIPIKELTKNNIFLLYNSGNFKNLKTTMVSYIGTYGAIQAYSDSYCGGGGFGGGGGGSGGGGGGAF